MTQYYYLATLLPEIQIGAPIELSFHELLPMLEVNLKEQDFQKTLILRSFFDIQNIRAFWKGEPLDPYGNFNELEMEEALGSRIGLPDFVYDYMAQYDDLEMQIRHFPQLVSWFFEEMKKETNWWLRDYMQLERDLRIIFTAFRAKKLGRDVVSELQYEAADDEIVAQIIAQKDTKSYEPPYRYSNLKTLFEEYQNQPMDLHQALCEYRFEKIEEILGIELFSIEKILAYMARLMIAERWLELDKKKGMEVIDHIVKEAS